MTNDINKELDRIEKRLNELDNDPVMQLIHENYLAMLKEASQK